jgi:hypothetical protein
LQKKVVQSGKALWKIYAETQNFSLVHKHSVDKVERDRDYYRRGEYAKFVVFYSRE